MLGRHRHLGSGALCCGNCAFTHAPHPDLPLKIACACRCVALLGGSLKHELLHSAASSAAPTTIAAAASSGSSAAGSSSFFDDLYTVMVWIFGQELPSVTEAGPQERAFSLATAAVGLTGFAMVLALMEQVRTGRQGGGEGKGELVCETSVLPVLLLLCSNPLPARQVCVHCKQGPAPLPPRPSSPHMLTWPAAGGGDHAPL